MKIRIYALIEDKTIPLVIYEGYVDNCPDIDTTLFAHGVKFSIEVVEDED